MKRYNASRICTREVGETFSTKTAVRLCLRKKGQRFDYRRLLNLLSLRLPFVRDPFRIPIPSFFLNFEIVRDTRVAQVLGITSHRDTDQIRSDPRCRKLQRSYAAHLCERVFEYLPCKFSFLSLVRLFFKFYVRRLYYTILRRPFLPLPPS